MRIVIPLFPGFTALDAVGPYEVLRMLPGVEIVWAAAAGPGPVRDGVDLLTLYADTAFEDVAGADLLVVPGGPGARSGVTDQVLLDWIRRIDATTTWTTSVCTGSLLLGAAGLLDGLRATTHWSAVAQLESYGAQYAADERVVEQDGGLFTAAGVSSGIDMALTLAARIEGETAAQAFQLGIEYDPRPPFDSGSYAKAPQAAKDYLASGAARRRR